MPELHMTDNRIQNLLHYHDNLMSIFHPRPYGALSALAGFPWLAAFPDANHFRVCTKCFSFFMLPAVERLLG